MSVLELDRPVATTTVDGRRARRDRNRDAVVDALASFLDDGISQPTARQLADRSGVSLRSVFRYCDRLDELMLAAIPRFVDTRLGGLVFHAPPAGSSFAERRDAWVDHQLGLFPRYARIAVAVYGRRRDNPGILALFGAYRLQEAAYLADLFAPELDALDEGERTVALAALHTATIAELWINLVDRHGVDGDAVRDVLVLLVTGALAPDAPPAPG